MDPAQQRAVVAELLMTIAESTTRLALILKEPAADPAQETVAEEQVPLTAKEAASFCYTKRDGLLKANRRGEVHPTGQRGWRSLETAGN